MSDADAAAGPADAERPTDADRPQPVDVGAVLVAAREAAGLSVDDVASRTRIRASLIRSMESGDFAPCGGAVYARGHLRSIAHVVGADDKAWVAAYDQMAGQPSPSALTVSDPPAAARPASVPFATLAKSTRPPAPANTVQVTGHPDAPASPGPSRPGGGSMLLPGSRPERDRRGSPLVIGAIGVVALIIVVAVVALVRPHHSGSNHVTASVSTPAASSPAPTASPTPTAPQTLADAGVNVVVTISSSPSWVHVVDATGTLVYQGILTPGTSKSFHSAQQLKFIFGYAPAVQLTVNGHAIGSPPATGSSDVADAVFDAQSGA